MPIKAYFLHVNKYKRPLMTYRDLKNMYLTALNHDEANMEWHTINNNLHLSDILHALNSLIL